MGAWGVGTFGNDEAGDWVYRAIDQVAADSELKELWAESDETEAWTDRLQELRGRIAP
jgi:hypothetical protein